MQMRLEFSGTSNYCGTSTRADLKVSLDKYLLILGAFLGFLQKFRHNWFNLTMWFCLYEIQVRQLWFATYL